MEEFIQTVLKRGCVSIHAKKEDCYVAYDFKDEIDGIKALIVLKIILWSQF